MQKFDLNQNCQEKICLSRINGTFIYFQNIDGSIRKLKRKKTPHYLIYIVISFMVCLPPSLIFDILGGRKYIATLYIALLTNTVL